MSERNYTTSFTVDQAPEAVFAAVNNVRGWWSEDVEGKTDELGAEFEFRSNDLHRSTQKITEWIPGKKVVWHVLDSQISFVQDEAEWTDTDIVFEIARKDGRTELRFTHVGLAPAIECYTACSDAWGFYVNRSLFNLITTGKGNPAEL
ncbi:MAG: SRPBCC domain-containing protein [Anaerolineae bacterium]|nr:SRPBCC domain-containing protein [Anaerolineae bacterium]